jgi:FkbM family methyltransferase
MKLNFPEGFDYVKQDFEKTGVWEPRTTEYIKKNLKIGDIFLDVGANVGYFTMLAAECGAEVLAFEPSKLNREFLSKNIKDNKFQTHTTVFNSALSNKNERQVELFQGNTPGENSLKKNYHNGSGSEKVDIVRYDDLDLPAPNMIKIDIEGNEKEALEGMQGILTTKYPITLILEDWDNSVTNWLISEYGWNLVTTDRASGNRILTKNMPFKYKEEPITCHLLGTFNAPNTLRDEGIGNAFGTKVVNMAKILKKLGHKVIFYGVEGSDVECDEFVQVSTLDDLKKTYGEWDKTKIYKENYGDYCHKIFNLNCIREINNRRRVGDFLLLCHGTFHKEIADAVNIPDTIEIGIGHRSSFARFRIFESEFQRAWTYGREDNDLNPNPIPGNRGKGNGNFYDCVIPGFFDPDDFEYCAQKDDYFLYLGRVISLKGIFIAQQVCEKLNKRLVVAGFGYDKDANAVDNKAFEDLLKMKNVEYVGFAGKEKRKELMAHAKALFLPTLYLEPFGYVVIEANLSGTPVITTDFGAFPETVKDGYNGFRCRNFKEFCEAAKNVETLSPCDCRKWGLKYTLDKTAPLYKRYFTHILNLIGKGWYHD